MNVLIVGSGGREHALAWKIRQSPRVKMVRVAPGNAGTALEDGVKNVPIAADNIARLVDFVDKERIDLTIVGPEAPLVLGIVDALQSKGLACFGPNAAAARLEGSKQFAKDFLQRHAIPTAAYASFTDLTPALEHVTQCQLPVVIKADGLAAGKGVVIAHTDRQAIRTVEDMLSKNRFGQAGQRIVIEEFVLGNEVSFICMVDGEHILPLATSQDHKAAYDADRGPNTGGMGAYSPAMFVDRQLSDRVIDQIILPTVQGMKAEGNPYTGFLYAGLMIGVDGYPKVLEFNCRLGDPETQPIMMRLKSDLLEHCLAALDGQLAGQTAIWDERTALGVVLAAKGYPGAYEKGKVISGITSEKHNRTDCDRKLFHAGTALNKGQITTLGGRVLCATALGDDIRQAQLRAYELARTVYWPGCWSRSDIGYRALCEQ